MSEFKIRLRPEFVNFHHVFLEEMNGICQLLSLYNGPRVSSDSLAYTSSGQEARGMANEYAFTYQSHAIGVFTFGYFFKGDALLRIVSEGEGMCTVTLSPSHGSVAEIELRKVLLKHEINEHEPAQISVRNEKQGNFVVFRLTRMPISNGIFLAAMSEVCAQLSKGLAPIFDGSMIVQETITETHEQTARLEVENNGYQVRFLDYSYDSGSHSYPAGYRFEFDLSQVGKSLIQMHRQREELVFKTTLDLEEFQSVLLKHLGDKL